MLELDSAIPNNCANTFCFYSREPDEVDYALRLLSHNDREAMSVIGEKYRELETRHCLVISNEERLPLLLEIPFFEEKIIQNERKEIEKKKFSNQFLAYKHLRELLPKEEITYNDRKIIPPYECDIALPKRKIAIHWNGVRYHSSRKQVEIDLLKNKLLKEKEWESYSVMDYGMTDEEIKDKMTGLVEENKCTGKEL